MDEDEYVKILCEQCLNGDVCMKNLVDCKDFTKATSSNFDVFAKAMLPSSFETVDDDSIISNYLI